MNSIKKQARVAGLLYLLASLSAPFALIYVPSTLIVPGDATGDGVLMTPTLANGKICYVEMPASDTDRSAEFYEKVFGWRIRKRDDGGRK